MKRASTICLLVLIAVTSNTFADVIAYWRFDDKGDPEIQQWGPVANAHPIPDSDGWTVWRKAVHDHSGKQRNKL